MVKNCTVASNKGDGIQAGNQAAIAGCNAVGNGNGAVGSGIAAGDNSSVVSCNVQGNKNHGIQLGLRCQVKDCNANGNGTGATGSGISTGVRAMVKDCTATENRENGIVVGAESIVIDSRGNHNGLGGATFAAGIKASSGAGSRIEGNQARENTGYGVLAALGTVVIRNTAGANTVADFQPSTGANFGPVQSPNTAGASPLGNIVF